MPFTEALDAAGRRVRVDITDGVYTRTIDGAIVEQRAPTAAEASNFGPSLPTLPPVADPLVALQAQLDALTDIVLGGGAA